MRSWQVKWDFEGYIFTPPGMVLRHRDNLMFKLFGRNTVGTEEVESNIMQLGLRSELNFINKLFIHHKLTEYQNNLRQTQNYCTLQLLRVAHPKWGRRASLYL